MTDKLLPGQVRQERATTPADRRKPFMPPEPGGACNARLNRGPGYCEAGAGHGTDHPGIGRCRIHGGASPRHEGIDGPLDLFRAAGLGPIINLAETMTHDDQEYLMEVGNNALVVTRASIMARLQHPETSPKEMADLTMALSRVDAILAKYPNIEDPDSAPNTPSMSLNEELARLESLDL